MAPFMVAAVTEFVAETPALGRSFCPGCEPDADPTLEILDVRWCDAHLPHRDGSDDGTVRSEAFLSGSAEAGGDANRLWCQLLHRDAPRLARRRPRRPRDIDPRPIA
ncbi:MAG: hypothetical protein DME08_03185 [Candidatus Rokuibacteriota bacterium]|nr:MAG: hypothetical protein DME08_03185 [Candidatus Rokubacteria bacterium]PYN98608.1 MAG: hypothetical protein DMD89_13360 [Candidatus Rokubacteria bacterium]